MHEVNDLTDEAESIVARYVTGLRALADLVETLHGATMAARLRHGAQIICAHTTTDHDGRCAACEATASN